MTSNIETSVTLTPSLDALEIKHAGGTYTVLLTDLRRRGYQWPSREVRNLAGHYAMIFGL